MEIVAFKPNSYFIFSRCFTLKFSLAIIEKCTKKLSSNVRTSYDVIVRFIRCSGMSPRSPGLVSPNPTFFKVLKYFTFDQKEDS